MTETEEGTSLIKSEGTNSVEEEETVTRKRTFARMFWKVSIPSDKLENDWPTMTEGEKYLLVARRIRMRGNPPEQGELGRSLEKDVRALIAHIDDRAKEGFREG